MPPAKASALMAVDADAMPSAVIIIFAARRRHARAPPLPAYWEIMLTPPLSFLSPTDGGRARATVRRFLVVAGFCRRFHAAACDAARSATRRRRLPPASMSAARAVPRCASGATQHIFAPQPRRIERCAPVEFSDGLMSPRSPMAGGWLFGRISLPGERARRPMMLLRCRKRIALFAERRTAAGAPTALLGASDARAPARAIV